MIVNAPITGCKTEMLTQSETHWLIPVWPETIDRCTAVSIHVMQARDRSAE